MERSFVWDIMYISTERSRSDEELTPFVLNYLEDLKSRHDLHVVGLNTDLCGSYASTRRIVQAQMRDLTYLPCFAQQTNLILGDIFKSVPGYKETSKKAIKVVAISNASTNTWDT